MERKEIFGDELVDLLDSVGIRIPELDYGDEAIWPAPFFAIASSRDAAAAEGAPAAVSERRPREAADRRAASRSVSTRPPRTSRARSARGAPATAAGSRSSTSGSPLVARRSALGALSSCLRQRRLDPGRRRRPGRRATPTARRTRGRADRRSTSRSATGSERRAARRRDREPADGRLEPAGGQHPGPDPRDRRPAGHSRSAARSRIARSRSSTRRTACSTCSAATAQGCSIASGKPSPERHLLLRREALELALYTFKYMTASTRSSVFLPPPPGGETASTVAFFLQRATSAPSSREPLDGHPQREDARRRRASPRPRRRR